MALTSGTKLGPYEIQSSLGAGGMGEVYLARDTRLERTVAVKILPTHFSSSPEARQRFEREAKTISKLNHPNICILHDIGSDSGVNYLIMERVEGETLASRLQKGPLSLQQALKYGSEIADALDKAHRCGVVHRDLKPENIMLTPTGSKLLDFGLAKPAAALVTAATITAAAPNSRVTEQGTIIGTFQYMSPEQIEGKDLDGRSDIFSLGAVLYEMITGKRAFEGKSQLSVVSAILEKEPVPISDIKPLSPPALDHAIRRSLAKDPNERWQTARDFALELKWIAEAGPSSGATNPAPAWWKSPALAWGVCTISLLALAWLFVAGFNRSIPASSAVRAEIVPPPDAEFYSRDVEGGAPAISPDGRQIVVAVRDKQGTVMLWLRQVDSGTIHPLPGTEGAEHPFWSPDSRSIGFFAQGKLKRIDENGGDLRVLCDVSLSPRGGTWNRDGVILFTPSVSDLLYRVSADGGTPVPATVFDEANTEAGHRWPQFLADSNHFLFFVRSYNKERTGIYAGSLDSKQHRFVLHTGYRALYVPGYLIYLQDKTLVAQPFDVHKAELGGQPTPLPDHPALVGPNSAAMFSASDTGLLVYYPNVFGSLGWDLMWHDRSGKRLGSIGQDFFSMPSISPDATKVAAGVFDPTWWTPDLWIIDLARRTKTRFTFGPGSSGAPVWQPDGQAIIYNHSSSGTMHIYRKELNGKNPEPLLETNGVNESPRSVCHDGRYLAYSRTGRTPQARSELWILPLFGDRKPFPLVQSQFDSFEAAFSPDCKWVAFRSTDPGQPEVYVTSFPDGARKYQVSTGGGVTPYWRADGKEMFFFDPQTANIMAVNVEESGEKLTLGTPHVLFQAPGIGYRLGIFAASPDGQRFLVNGDPPTMSAVSAVPLTLVLNWQAQLKK